MKITGITAVLGTVAALAITACGGSASLARSAVAVAAPANRTSSAATCAQADGTIQNLADAQATFSASQQTETEDVVYILALEEASAIIRAGGPLSAKPRWSPVGTGQLNRDLFQFNADARQFTQGDTSMLSAVDSDIDALAADCSVSATLSGSGSAATGGARGMMGAMTANDAWAELVAEGFSPFKVICAAHKGSQLVRRGGAREAEDGFVHVLWLPHGDSPVPQSGAGVVHADGSRTFELTCPKCGKPKEVRQDHLVRLLQDRAHAGVTDAKGRVVLDLAELTF